MKRTIEIVSSFSGKISTGQFENEQPFFSVKEVIEGEITDVEISKRQKELKDICYNQFQLAERESTAKKIQKQREDIRFYEKDGKSYPSVTSIIGWDADMFCKKEDLSQYASQGNINHLKLAYFIKTGEFLDAKKIPEAYKDMVILSKGSLKLPIDSGDLKGMLEKYPIRFKASEQEVINDTYLYAGTLDALGEIVPNKDWEKLGAQPDLLTVFDLKRSGDAIKNFKQTSAYAKCIGAEQMIILIVNDTTKQGFSQPLVTQSVDEYFAMFLQDREAFKERFGV